MQNFLNSADIIELQKKTQDYIIDFIRSNPHRENNLKIGIFPTIEYLDIALRENVNDITTLMIQNRDAYLILKNSERDPLKICENIDGNCIHISEQRNGDKKHILIDALYVNTSNLTISPQYIEEYGILSAQVLGNFHEIGHLIQETIEKEDGPSKKLLESLKTEEEKGLYQESFADCFAVINSIQQGINPEKIIKELQYFRTQFLYSEIIENDLKYITQGFVECCKNITQKDLKNLNPYQISKITEKIICENFTEQYKNIKKIEGRHYKDIREDDNFLAKVIKNSEYHKIPHSMFNSSVIQKEILKHNPKIKEILKILKPTLLFERIVNSAKKNQEIKEMIQEFVPNVKNFGFKPENYNEEDYQRIQEILKQKNPNPQTNSKIIKEIAEAIQCPYAQKLKKDLIRLAELTKDGKFLDPENKKEREEEKIEYKNKSYLLLDMRDQSNSLKNKIIGEEFLKYQKEEESKEKEKKEIVIVIISDKPEEAERISKNLKINSYTLDLETKYMSSERIKEKAKGLIPHIKKIFIPTPVPEIEAHLLQKRRNYSLER